MIMAESHPAPCCPIADAPQLPLLLTGLEHDFHAAVLFVPDYVAPVVPTMPLEASLVGSVAWK
jgi:hypothetical protein